MKAVLSIVAVAGLTASTASGDIAYNNFGPGNGGFDYNWGLGWTVAGPNNGSGQFGVEQAHLFTPSVGGELSDIWVPIWRVPFSSPADEVTIHIASKSGNAPTAGDILESWTLDTFPSWTAWSAPHHLESAGGITLDAGTEYWIWMEGGDTTWAGWAHNSDPALTLPHTLRREGQGWTNIFDETAGALRVDVVPAPGTAVLAGLGSLVMVRRRRSA